MTVSSPFLLQVECILKSDFRGCPEDVRKATVVFLKQLTTIPAISGPLKTDLPPFLAAACVSISLVDVEDTVNGTYTLSQSGYRRSTCMNPPKNDQLRKHLGIIRVASKKNFL